MINIESKSFDLNNDIIKSNIIFKKYIINIENKYRNPIGIYIINFLYIYKLYNRIYISILLMISD
jgi:hypothetical protein